MREPANRKGLEAVGRGRYFERKKKKKKEKGGSAKARVLLKLLAVSKEADKQQMGKAVRFLNTDQNGVPPSKTTSVGGGQKKTQEEQF